MKRARLTFDLMLLAEMLHFPAGVTIERVITDQRIHSPRHCEFVIAGDALPIDETGEGEVIPQVEGRYTNHDDFLTGIPRVTVTFHASSETS